MPHAIIEGRKINFELIYSNFTKILERHNNFIIKFDDSFISHSKDLILLKTTVIENTVNQKYYIQLMRKDNQITIRLDPISDPLHKNYGVKMSIAMIAKIILSLHNESDELRITKTNLLGFLTTN